RRVKSTIDGVKSFSSFKVTEPDVPPTATPAPTPTPAPSVDPAAGVAFRPVGPGHATQFWLCPIRSQAYIRLGQYSDPIDRR
ncbi:uncharacterized protein METZ01_LOCUS191926, partial [marine metagenome]